MENFPRIRGWQNVFPLFSDQFLAGKECRHRVGQEYIMNGNSLTFFIQTSSKQPGALGLFHVYGAEKDLALILDSALSGKINSISVNRLQINELRYGWLREADGRVVDEVMLAKPVEGVRVLMTHGGVAVQEAVTGFLLRRGCAELGIGDAGKLEQLRAHDPLLDRVLAACLTEPQVAAVLKARQGMAAGEKVVLPERLLLTHRLVLAGPPNAGKSSLMNRLAGYERAFVHEDPGATLDVVDELVNLAGFAVLLGDLPGFAEGGDELDRAAWLKAVERLRLAEAVLFVCDGSRPWEGASDRAAREVAAALSEVPGGAGRVLVVVNKSDLPPVVEGDPWREHFPKAGSIQVCSLPGGDAEEKVGEAVLRWFA